VLLTDTEGLVQALRVVPASVQDRDTPALLEPELATSRLRKVWADLAFAGERAAAPLARHDRGLAGHRLPGDRQTGQSHAGGDLLG
jgi:hypothetical protein